jgi:class 3 adenylate cyclase
VLNRHVHSRDQGKTGEGIKLALHVAITAGEMQLMHVGGLSGQWEVLLAGEAMQALGPTAENAPTDHLVVEAKCWALLEGLVAGNPFAGQRLASPNESMVRVLAYDAPKGAAGLGKSFADGEHLDLGHQMVASYPVETLDILRRYVSPVVQTAVEARTLEAVSGFLDLSVIFVGISGLDLGAMSPDAGMLWGQVVMSSVQDCVFEQEGSVNKFVMDDKGALLLCAWGLPPFTHIDDPHRATAAAMRLADQLDALGIQAHIGVTTGKVFAGVIGPPHRCEFSMLGDTVNLSARLMCKAPFGGVYTDKPTYESAVKTGMEFEVLEPIKVKGKESIIPIFRPTKDGRVEKDKLALKATKEAAGKGKRESTASGTTLLSAGGMRDKERDQLLAILQDMFSRRGGMLMLSGEAGSGKTELAKMVTKSAERFNARLIESLTPKTQTKVKDVASWPCTELSQVLRGLLTSGPEAAAAKTTAQWRDTLRAMVGSGFSDKELASFDVYFQDWAEGASEEVEDNSPAGRKAKALRNLMRSTNSAAPSAKTPRSGGEAAAAALAVDEDEGVAEEEISSEAATRLALLTAVIDKVLATSGSLMIFVHVRTGSSLSEDAIHPEMWPLLKHLSELGSTRYKSSNAPAGDAKHTCVRGLISEI